METKSQIETHLKWTREQLLAKGYVTRNEALRNYNTRLGSRIWDLKQEGMQIEDGKYIKTENGRDFIYRLKQKSVQLSLI